MGYRGCIGSVGIYLNHAESNVKENEKEMDTEIYIGNYRD